MTSRSLIQPAGQDMLLWWHWGLFSPHGPALPPSLEAQSWQNISGSSVGASWAWRGHPPLPHCLSLSSASEVGLSSLRPQGLELAWQALASVTEDTGTSLGLLFLVWKHRGCEGAGSGKCLLTSRADIPGSCFSPQGRQKSGLAAGRGGEEGRGRCSSHCPSECRGSDTASHRKQPTHSSGGREHDQWP